jgi:hypothetical protein
MPTISVPSFSEKSPSGLPLPNGGDRRRGGAGLSPSRRLIQLVKSRGRWSTPFMLLVVAGLLLFALTSTRGDKAPAVPVPRKTDVPAHNNHGAGAKAPGGRVGAGAGTGSKVTHHHDDGDDEFLADDEKAVDNAVEEASRTEEEIAAEGEAIKSKEAEVANDKMFQTRSLIWWIGQNGKFPLDFQEPTGEEIEAMGIKGFQEMLLKADPEQVDVFEDSWVVHAESMQRVTMFSKVSPARVCVWGRVLTHHQTYCPYSKNGKNILKQYSIHPQPYIIELDTRGEWGRRRCALQRPPNLAGGRSLRSHRR